MANKKLYFTIGLPRSGKSTLSKYWQSGMYDLNESGTLLIASFIETKNDRVVVTPDNWRLALGHRYNWYVEPVVFSHVQVAVRALNMTHDILLDDTHTTEESIKRVLEVNPDAIPVLMDTGPFICNKRALDCGQKDLVPVINRMWDNMLETFGPEFSLISVLEKVSQLRTEVLAHASRKVIV